MTDLTIIIVSYETREVTLSCLASIEREVRTGNGCLETQTILVDNASQDGTAAAVQARFPWVTLLPLSRNVGFAKGCNVGLREAKGRHAVLLNPDTVVRRGALERCVAYLDAHPDVGIVGPQLLHPDGRRQNSVHAAPGLWSELVPRGVLETLFPRRFPSKRRHLAGPTEVDAVLGACLVVRRQVWETVGGLPEEYFLFLEETDWCWSVRGHGWRVIHLPDVQIVHLSGASSKQKDPVRTRIEYHRSLYRFLEKRRGRGVARVVRGQRVVKGIAGLVMGALLAPFSGRQRRRLVERARLLSWHAARLPGRRGPRRRRAGSGGGRDEPPRPATPGTDPRRLRARASAGAGRRRARRIPLG